MPKNDLTYRAQVAQERTLMIRAVAKDLPKACGQFLRAIDQTTTELTRLGYARDLKLFFHYLTSELPDFAHIAPQDFADRDLQAITSEHIEMYLEYLTYYLNENDDEFTNNELGKMRKLCSLRSFFHYLYRNKRVSADVSTLVETPKRHEKPIIRMEIDEVARMLDLIESGDALTDRQKKFHEITRMRDLTICTLFLGTGIRVSELVGLNIDDLDFDSGSFLVTRKGGNQVILYFPDEVAEQLRAYVPWRNGQEALPGHEDALFLSIQKKRMTVRAVELMVKKYALQAAPLKRRLSPHKLRSTFGTNLYRETGDIYLVADVLGHSDVNTTRRHYAAMSEDRRRMAAKAVVLREDKPAQKPESPAEDSGKSDG